MPCPGRALPGWQDHLWSASSLRLQPMRPWLPPVCRRGACFPLSACVCTSRVILVWRVCGSPLYTRLALAVRYSLTLWFGISRRVEETPTKMRRNMWVGLCECSCVWVLWILINLPKVLHLSSAKKPRGKKQTQLWDWLPSLFGSHSLLPFRVRISPNPLKKAV